MKKIHIILLFLSLNCLINLTSYSQEDYFHCGSQQAHQKMMDANPQLKQEFIKRKAELALKDQQDYAKNYNNNSEKKLLPIYTIPVVFHIIHQAGSENISDNQIFDAMRILNEAFRKQNSSASNTVSAFQSIAADSEIEFRLAQNDPNGICTNGIDRIYSSETNIGDDDSKLNPWPSDYLNIWVVKLMESGAAGYAYLPGTAFPDVDGIIILSQYVGSIGTGSVMRSTALTHEVGHYLNLLHTWGYTNDPGVDCLGTDDVSDTPPTKGWTSCNLSGATCSSPLDNIQNYMEYAYCSTMYTEGQKTRMRNALTSSAGQRSSLWTTANLIATGISLPAVLCKSDFKSNNINNTVCQGNSLTFNDIAWNGVPTAWNWTFQGGTPATSTDSVPVIQYLTGGIFNVGLTVSNGSGSATVSKTGFVTVNSSTASHNASFFSEDFEGSSIPNANWNVRNQEPGANTWVQTTAAAASGSKSVRILNNSNADGNIDELICSSINLTAITNNLNFTFKVAHAQKTSAHTDKLQVLISTNCGLSWTLRYTKAGAALSTAGVQNSSFTPNASQWIEHSVSLAGYSFNTNFYIMFRFTSNGGNNIYIDDINLGGANGIDEGHADLFNFNVYPNPANNKSVISFNMDGKHKVDLKLYDLTGREILTLLNENLAAGDYQFSISEKTELLSGIYFVKLNIDQKQLTKKIIIKND